MRDDVPWSNACVCHAMCVEGGVALAAATALLHGIDPETSFLIVEGLFFTWWMCGIYTGLFRQSLQKKYHLKGTMEGEDSILLASLEGLEVLLDAEGDTGFRMAQRMLEAKQAMKAVQDGPWFVMGHLLSLQNWIPEAAVHEVSYDKVEFWVQLHGLPLEYMSNSNAVKVARLLGDIVMIEDPYVGELLLRPFLRVRVMIDIKKQLVTGFWLPRKDLPKVWDKLMAVFDNSKPRFGAFLGVPPARSLAAIATENSRRHRKIHGEDEAEKAGGDHPADNEGDSPTKPDSAETAHPSPPTTNANREQQGQKGNVRADKSALFVFVDPSFAPEQRFIAASVIYREFAALTSVNPTYFSTACPQAQIHLSLNIISPPPRPSPPIQPNPSFPHQPTTRTQHVKIPEPPSNPPGCYQPSCVDLEDNIKRPAQKRVVGSLVQEFQKSANLKRDREDDPDELVYNTTGEKRTRTSVFFPILTLPPPSSNILKELQQRLRFSNSFYVDPRGQSGGLGLLWDDSVEVEVEANCRNFIHCSITIKKESTYGNAPLCMGTLLLGPRRQLWGQLGLLTTGKSLHLVSNPRDGVVVRERIDRVLVNSNWRFLFPHASVSALPAISSDHSPILFEVCPKDRSGMSFKYELMWDKHPECIEVVKGAGQINQMNRKFGGRMFKKARNCRRAITNWHKTKFCNAAKELPKLKTRLQSLQNYKMEGSWLEGKDIIMNAAVDHCTRVYSAENISVSSEEIKRAVDGLRRLKGTWPRWAEWASSSLLTGILLRMDHALISALEDTLDIKALENPGSYLGLSADWSRSKSRTLAWILNRVQGKINGWKESLLNMAGKEMLIKSVIQAIPTYAMSVFKFPRGFCSKLNSMVANFWWQGSRKDREVHWRSWQFISRRESISLPQISCRQRKVINPLGFGPAFWKGGSLERRNGQWLIADGRDIKTWEDKWLWSKESLQNFQQPDASTLHDLLDTNNRRWDTQRIRQLLPPNMAVKGTMQLKGSSTGVIIGICFLYPISCALEDYLEAEGLVWFGSQFNWFPSPSDVTRFDEWLMGKFDFILNSPQLPDSLIDQLVNLVWSIWKQRNNMCSIMLNRPITVINQAACLSREYALARVNSSSSSQQSARNLKPGSHWKCPPPQVLKCNVDAAWHGPHVLGAVAFIVRDSTGKVLVGHAKRVPVASPIVAEALALREAILSAYNFNWQRIVLESDCLLLIEACRREKVVAEIKGIVEDILPWMRVFCSVASPGFRGNRTRRPIV
ncbi:Ribonuclease H superfamily [Sesbania bispinosa]|nr:Ribonuclease H superfamily [Sesbania bispinosa]